MTLDSLCKTCNKSVTYRETLLNAIYASIKHILSVTIQILLIDKL